MSEAKQIPRCTNQMPVKITIEKQYMEALFQKAEKKKCLNLQ